MRRDFPAKVKAIAFQRANGCCENPICRAKIAAPKLAYDHILPDALGGEPTLENCQVLCLECHQEKTGTDVGRIRKADRQHRNHIGAKARIGFRGWRNFRGEAIWRDQR